MAAQPRRNVSLLGLSYSLDVEPRNRSGCFYPCPRCRAQTFDGGIPKLCTCSCGETSLRGEDNTVTVQPAARMATFDDQFRVRTISPPSDQIPKLLSVTFGFFATGDLDPDMALRSALLPFSLHRDRCYGVNDLVECCGLRFKVLAAEPIYGVIGRGTKIQCHEVVKTEQLASIKIIAVYPKSLTIEDFNASINGILRRPFFHIHQSNVYPDQYIYTPSLQCVILESTPKSGFMGPQTQVIIERKSLEGMHQAFFQPIGASLPPEYLNLHPQQLEQVLLDGYLMPHFRGWYRPIMVGEVIKIGGIDFQVAPGGQPFGFVGAQTRVVVDLRHLVRMQRVVAVGPNLTVMHHHQIIMRQAASHQQRFTTTDTRKSLPTKIATQAYIEGDHNTCVVCLDDYVVGEKIKTLPCCKS